MSFMDYKGIVLTASLQALKSAVVEEFSQTTCSDVVVKCDQAPFNPYDNKGMSDVKGQFIYKGFDFTFNFSKSGGEFYGNLPDGSITTSRSVQSHLNKIDKIIKKLNKN